MICIHCQAKNTRVANSRTHKKTAQIWRRRHCEACKATFTTYERPSFPDELIITHSKTGQRSHFNPGILIIDFYSCLQTITPSPAEDAFWLVRSLEDALASLPTTHFTTAELKNHAHAILNQFQPMAGIQYAAKHRLLHKLK